MQLKEFIKMALLEIVQGVEDAQTELKDNRSSICPILGPAYVDKVAKSFIGHAGIYYQEAEFDVAVTVENKTDGGAGAGINVAGLFELKGGGNTSSNNSTLSRIRFHVPLGLGIHPKTKQ